MIRRHLLMSAAVVTLTLAGCDGGNDSSSPTPTPTATSTATPTPSPTYSSLPLAAATEFATINAFTQYTGNFATGPVVLGSAGTEGYTDRVRLAVNNVTTGEFVIRETTEESRFSTSATPAATLNPAPSTSVTEYAFRKEDATVGSFTQLNLLNNTIKDVVTSDTQLALSRVSYANWYRSLATAGPTRFTSAVFGYPTYAVDMPTTGTATYTGRVSGRIFRATAAGPAITNAVRGTVTITVNFSTGAISATSTLVQVGASGGTESPLGTFTGTGALATGVVQFTGNFGAASALPGTLNGLFFGSQGEQLGIVFAGAGNTVQDATTYDTRIVAAIVAKKN